MWKWARRAERIAARARGAPRSRLPLLRSSDRVLLRTPSWLGDFVLAEPIARVLHERLVERGSGALTLAGPARLLALLEGRFPGARRIALGARAEEDPSAWRGHDLALLLDGSWRSAWCAFRARIPERVAWARGGRSPLLTYAPTPARERGALPSSIARTRPFPRFLPRPFGSTCVELAHLIGLQVHDPRPSLPPSERGLALARERLERAGLAAGEPFLLFNAARRPGSAKGLDAATTRALLTALERRLALPILAHAAPGEEEDARAVLTELRGTRIHGACDPSPDLHELLALVALAACYVTPDSGPRHLATASGTPCVALFGPTDPRHTADFLERTRMLRVELPCSPCHEERCPLSGPSHHACMREIAPEQVVAAVGALLALDPARRER